MKKVIIIAFISLSVVGYSQKTDPASEVARGAILKDDVENIRFYLVSLPIINFNLNNYNTSVYDAVIGIHAQPSSNLYIHANYNLGLLERVYPERFEGSNQSVMSAMSVYKNSFSNSFSIEGTYFFKKVDEKKDLRIRLKSKSVGNTTYTTVTDIEGTLRTTHGFRLGFTKGVTWMAFKNADITGIDQNGKELQLLMDDRSTYLYYNQLRLGYSFTKTTNLHVMMETYGYRRNAGMEYFYIDGIINIQSELEDVYAAYDFNGSNLGPNPHSTYYKRYDINSTTPKARLGFAVGKRVIPISSVTSYNIEGGLFPGVRGEFNAYFKVGLNVMFGTSERLSPDTKVNSPLQGSPAAP